MTAWRIALTLASCLALIGPARAWQVRNDGLPLPDCAEVRASKLVGGALADSFDRRYPKTLAGETSVEAVALDPALLANVVGYLACVSGLTEGDVNVAEQGLALFASRRYGRAAFAALDGIARSGAPEAAAARRFAKQMRGYLAGPGPGSRQ